MLKVVPVMAYMVPSPLEVHRELPTGNMNAFELHQYDFVCVPGGKGQTSPAGN